jgi:hypothetical protein
MQDFLTFATVNGGDERFCRVHPLDKSELTDLVDAGDHVGFGVEDEVPKTPSNEFREIRLRERKMSPLATLKTSWWCIRMADASKATPP